MVGMWAQHARPKDTRLMKNRASHHDRGTLRGTDMNKQEARSGWRRKSSTKAHQQTNAPQKNAYVAYWRPGGGSGPMQAYPHLRADTPEEDRQQWLEYAKNFVGQIEYWITTEHIHGYTKKS